LEEVGGNSDDVDLQQHLNDLFANHFRELSNTRLQREQTDPLLTANKGENDFILDHNVDGTRLSKRPRQFVGKRGVFGDQHTTPDDKEYREVFRNRLASYLAASSIVPPHKRIREFVGKRADEVGDSFGAVKQLGEILGQTADTRLREFLTNMKYLEDSHNDDAIMTKRSRELIGKRPANGDEIDEDKRPRQFVGKRETSNAEEGGNEGATAITFISPEHQLGVLLKDR